MVEGSGISRRIGRGDRLEIIHTQLFGPQDLAVAMFHAMVFLSRRNDDSFGVNSWIPFLFVIAGRDPAIQVHRTKTGFADQVRE